MKLIALLPWYNESATWLAATITSLTRIGVDELVVVDGAYYLFPDARARSSIAEAQAVMLAADAANIGLTLVRPRDVWYGNEREKREFLFKVATAIGTPHEDWVFCIDADEVITEGTPTIKQELASTTCDVAVGYLYQWWDDTQADTKKAHIARQFPHPSAFGNTQTRFFRILDNMRLDTTHYTYIGDKDGVSYSLRGDIAGQQFGYPTASILTPDSRIEIEHRDPIRDMWRREAKLDYYNIRDLAKIEQVFDTAGEARTGTPIETLLPPHMSNETSGATTP